MHLNKLELSNFRCFESLSIDFDEQLTVLVAENGVGKTAILDAISIALSPFIRGFDTGTGKGFKSEDARLGVAARLIKKGFFILVSEAHRVSEMESQYPISLIASGLIDGQLEQWSRELTGKKTQTTFGKARVLIDYAKNLQQQVRAAESVILPILAYYGTGRLLKQGNTGRKNSTESRSRLYGYHDALNPDSSYKSFEKWFTDMSIAEYINESKARNELLLRTQELILRATTNANKIFRNASITSTNDDVGLPVEASDDPATRPYPSPLKFVQQAINQCLSISKWSTLEYEPNWSTLIVSNENKTFIPVSQLSDGVKAMLSLTADIAYRCVQLNPHLTSPIEETNGIVLIDEVDLHLHPKWQQTVLADLCKTFPKIQFIVTTHSPQVISTVSSRQIRILYKGQVYPAEEGTQGAESSRMLNEVFGTPSRAQNLEIVQKLNRYLALIDDDKWDTEDALALRQELDEWARGHEPELIKADIDIRMKEYQRQL